MRVTQNSTANLVRDNLQTILERQYNLEKQASTGYKVSDPGDDPVNAQQILHLKSLSAAKEQYTRNITSGTSILSMSDSAMSGMTDTLIRTKELALSMATETVPPEARTAAVKELEQLKSQLISLGNTQLNGRYIFAGFKNDLPPFDATTGAFTGTTDDLKLEIDRGSLMTVNYSGAALVSGGSPAGSSGVDMMAMMDNLIAAVGAGNTSGVQAELGNLDGARSQVLAGRAVVGSSLNRLTATQSIADDMDLTTTKVLSGIRDVDYMQVVSDLSKQQTAYQTAIAASAKISQVSLLDYLR